MPTITVVAGPNGSGKSTITRYLDFEGKDRLLDPDAIARRIDPVDPGRAAVTAGREAIRRTREYIATGVSFGIETTLSSEAVCRPFPLRYASRMKRRCTKTLTTNPYYF